MSLVEEVVALLKEKYPEVQSDGPTISVSHHADVSLVDEVESILEGILQREPDRVQFKAVVIAQQSYVFEVSNGIVRSYESGHDRSNQPVHQPSDGVAFNVIEAPFS